MSSSNEAMNWQDGMGTIQDRMKHLLDTGEKSDVEFLVGKESLKEEPQLFKAHKFVLSISSSVFNAQFQYEEQMPINVIDVSASAFKAMLTFLYTNDLSMINCENYLDVYSAAKKYMLHAFVEKCHELAPKMLNYVNSVPIWRGAKLQEDKILIEHCLKFLDENIQDISFWYLNLNHTECGELLKRDSLQVDHELTLFEFLKDWAESQLENLGINDPTGEQLRAEIGPLIYDIRFPMITPTDFIKHIVPTGILNAQEIAAMFIHYSEDSNDDLKQSYSLPFSTKPRTFTLDVQQDKLVSKNALEKENANLLEKIGRAEWEKAKREDVIQQLEKRVSKANNRLRACGKKEV